MMPGLFDVRRIPLDPLPVGPGSTLQPIARFVAERDGAECASVVLGRGEVFEREPPEYVLARLSWSEERLDAAHAVVTEAVRSAPIGTFVYFPVSAAVSVNHFERRVVAEGCGFGLFQEKEGFLWVDTGQVLPRPANLTLRPMSVVGRAHVTSLIGRCLAGTLDRNDAFVLAREGRAQEWAERFLERHAEPADEETWLVAGTPEGTPVGFVGVAGRADDPRMGTLVLVGVLPEHRGKRYVDALVHAGYHGARTRGFDRVFSLVDVANHPMMAAMRRTGNDPDAHPWHKWLYVRKSAVGEQT